MQMWIKKVLFFLAQDLGVRQQFILLQKIWQVPFIFYGIKRIPCDVNI